MLSGLRLGSSSDTLAVVVPDAEVVADEANGSLQSSEFCELEWMWADAGMIGWLARANPFRWTRGRPLELAELLDGEYLREASEYTEKVPILGSNNREANALLKAFKRRPLDSNPGTKQVVQTAKPAMHTQQNRDEYEDLDLQDRSTWGNPLSSFFVQSKAPVEEMHTDAQSDFARMHSTNIVERTGCDQVASVPAVIPPMQAPNSMLHRPKNCANPKQLLNNDGGDLSDDEPLDFSFTQGKPLSPRIVSEHFDVEDMFTEDLSKHRGILLRIADEKGFVHEFRTCKMAADWIRGNTEFYNDAVLKKTWKDDEYSFIVDFAATFVSSWLARPALMFFVFHHSKVMTTAGVDEKLVQGRMWKNNIFQAALYAEAVVALPQQISLEQQRSLSSQRNHPRILVTWEEFDRSRCRLFARFLKEAGRKIRKKSRSAANTRSKFDSKNLAEIAKQRESNAEEVSDSCDDSAGNENAEARKEKLHYGRETVLDDGLVWRRVNLRSAIGDMRSHIAGTGFANASSLPTSRIAPDAFAFKRHLKKNAKAENSAADQFFVAYRCEHFLFLAFRGATVTVEDGKHHPGSPARAFIHGLENDALPDVLLEASDLVAEYVELCNCLSACENSSEDRSPSEGGMHDKESGIVGALESQVETKTQTEEATKWISFEEGANEPHFRAVSEISLVGYSQGALPAAGCAILLDSWLKDEKAEASFASICELRECVLLNPATVFWPAWLSKLIRDHSNTSMPTASDWWLVPSDSLSTWAPLLTSWVIGNDPLSEGAPGGVARPPHLPGCTMVLPQCSEILLKNHALENFVGELDEQETHSANRNDEQKRFGAPQMPDELGDMFGKLGGTLGRAMGSGPSTRNGEIVHADVEESGEVVEFDNAGDVMTREQVRNKMACQGDVVLQPDQREEDEALRALYNSDATEDVPF